MISRIRNFFRPSEAKALVLMYHRVCDIETDPWQLAVSSKNFESQIKELKQNFKVLPLSNLEEQFKNGKIEPNGVYLTFDDAYRDNYLNARPVLEKYNCPATFFIPTHFIGKQQLFWWDELESIFLHTQNLPASLTFSIGEDVYPFQIESEPLTEEVRLKQQAWIWPANPPTNRCKLYLKIWELLRPLPHTKIVEVIDSIRQWGNYSPSQSSENYAMNNDELEVLANNKLFSLGIHTMTHPALASHSKAIQSAEIVGSKDYLISRGFPQVNAVAYPYGNYNNETISVITENNIPLGFTTEEAAITKHSHPLCLGRIQVTDCKGSRLIEKLNHFFKS